MAISFDTLDQLSRLWVHLREGVDSIVLLPIASTHIVVSRDAGYKSVVILILRRVRHAEVVHLHVHAVSAGQSVLIESSIHR